MEKNPISKESSIKTSGKNITSRVSGISKINQNKQSTQDQNYPNDSIFNRNDNFYKMNTFLKFSSATEEEFCSIDLFVRNMEHLKITLIFSFLKTLFFLFFKWNQISYIVMFLNVIDVLIICILAVIILKINQFQCNIRDIRTILELDLVILIISRTLFDTFSTFEISMIFIICSYYNIVFSLPITDSSFYFSIEIIVILLNDGYPENLFLTRFFYNLLSKKFLTIILIFLASITVQSFIEKFLKELWALYDSFKKSYYSLKFIFDDFPYPIFVVSKKIKNVVLFKNPEAEQLLERVSKQKKIKEKDFTQEKPKNAPNRKESDICSFNELFNTKHAALFEREIEKCLDPENPNKSFYFPFVMDENTSLDFKEIPKGETLYDTNYYLHEWFKVVISPCVWKNQDSLLIELINVKDIFSHSIIEEQSQNINNELAKVIENIDMALENAKEIETEIKFNLGPSQAIPSSFSAIKSPMLLSRSPNFNRNTNTNVILSRYTAKTENGYDYNFLYYFKYSLNFIYDSNLTLDVFHSIKNRKILSKQSSFNLLQFLNYIKGYFFILAKQKYLSIIIKCDYKENVVGVYEYIRVVVFNILSFILNNSGNEANKPRELNIIVEEDKNKSGVFKFTLNFNDAKPIVEYDKLKSILDSNRLLKIDKDEIEKFECLDIGIFVANFIINNFFSSELVFQEISIHDFKIVFSISAHLEKEVNLESNLIRNFLPPKTKVDSSHYMKLLTKIYSHSEAPAINKQKIKLVNENLKDGDVINRKTFMKNSSSGITGNDYEETLNFEDKFNKEELKDVSIKKDEAFYVEKQHDLKKFLSCEESSLISSQDLIEKKKKVPKDRIYLPIEIKKTGNTSWNNTQMMNQISYCNPPRFLIVEDNVLGRKNLKQNLKKINKDFHIDNAINGKDAVQKFKNLFNKGIIFDIIFMDIELPEMRGIEASEKIRAYEREYNNIHTNIIAVTVQGKNDENMDCIDEHFEKPINPTKFNSSIIEHFEKKRPELKHLIANINISSK